MFGKIFTLGKYSFILVQKNNAWEIASKVPQNEICYQILNEVLLTNERSINPNIIKLVRNL